MHRSPYFGQSVEFRQHRQYTAGDDLRHVDWKVWARQDRLYVKQYEADTNLRCTLLVDVSNSMRYGRGPEKYEYACTVAVSLAYLILNRATPWPASRSIRRIRRSTPFRTHRTHINAVTETLAVSDPSDKTEICRACCVAWPETYPCRGLLVLISDLLADESRFGSGLRLLRQHGHDVLLFHIMDDDELDFPFNGPIRFEGLETSNAFMTCNPRALHHGPNSTSTPSSFRTSTMISEPFINPLLVIVSLTL